MSLSSCGARLCQSQPPFDVGLEPAPCRYSTDATQRANPLKKTIKLAKFDAVLDTDCCDSRNNAELTLKLKLGFRQINPAGGAASGMYNDYGSATGTARKIIKWTASEWGVWKANFVRSAQAFWHGKFWLSNQLGYFGYKAGGQIYLPNIWCRFDLIGSDASSGTHHFVIDVVRLDPSESWFGSHSTLYDSLDTRSVQKSTDSAGNAVMQRAHVHEVGHLLGLGHVDIGKAHCPAAGNTNAAACYGIADHDKNSVMGSGMQLRPEHAAPWMTAMQDFVKAEPKSPIYTIPSPTLMQVPARALDVLMPFVPLMKRHYPRTPAELEARKMITAR